MELNSTLHWQEPSPPSWDELREEGLVIVDDQMLKLGVYVGPEGAVVVKSQDFDDPQANHFFIEHHDAKKLIEALVKAHGIAVDIAADFDSIVLSHAQAEGATK